MVWELACERGRVWLLRRSEASRDARSKEGGGGLDWGGEGEEEQREGLGRDGWMDGRMDWTGMDGWMDGWIAGPPLELQLQVQVQVQVRCASPSLPDLINIHGSIHP